MLVSLDEISLSLSGLCAHLKALPRDLAEAGEREVWGMTSLLDGLAKLVQVLPEQLTDDNQVLLEVEEVAHVQHMVLVLNFFPVGLSSASQLNCC